MAERKTKRRESKVARFPDRGIPLDYCPSSPNTRHVFIQQEYDSEVKQCRWCRLLILPDQKKELA